MKCCKGLKAEAAKEKPATSNTKEASSSSSSSKKKKNQTKSQQSDLQPDSQTLLSMNSQASSCKSPCHSGCNKPKTAMATPPGNFTLAAKIWGKNTPQAIGIPVRSTRCTSLTNTRSNVAFPRTGKCPPHITPIIQCICRLKHHFPCIHRS